MKQLHVNRINKDKEYEHDEVHYINFPDYGEKGWYRMMISYSAFFESCNCRDESDSFLYYLYRGKDLRSPAEIEYEKIRDSKLPKIYHDSLYDFFEYIGYCRKKKRIISKKGGTD